MAKTGLAKASFGGVGLGGGEETPSSVLVGVEVSVRKLNFQFSTLNLNFGVEVWFLGGNETFHFEFEVVSFGRNSSNKMDKNSFREKL